MGPMYEGRQIMDDSVDDSLSSQRGSPFPSDDESLNRLESAFSFCDIDEDDDLTEEGRLSRALQSWMPEHEFSTLEPMEKPQFEPVFTGRLGGSKHLKHASSEESIVTALSLFSCSSVDSMQSQEEEKKRRKRKKVTYSASKRTNCSSASARLDINQRWERIANRKRVGELSRLMQSTNVMANEVYTGIVHEDDDEIYELVDADVKRGLIRAGRTTGIRLTSDLQKSRSMTNIKEVVSSFSTERKERRCSAGTRPNTKPINLEEIKRQKLNERLLQLQNQQHRLGRGGLTRRRSLSRPRLSVSSDVSSAFEQNSPSVRSVSPAQETERVSMWKGDSAILEMDLRRGLTGKAKKKIKSTTVALERVTGFGETNTTHRQYGRHEEFPFYVDDDYSLYPKIVQKIRVSPHLSEVITTDINVRMGRPRYHEISKRDIEVWTRGQHLDKGHRNLKVFNWLHSLREDEFVKDIEPVIDDAVPSAEDFDGVGILHVESADEPDVVPLYLKKFKI